MINIRVIIEYQPQGDGKENIKIRLIGAYASLRTISAELEWLQFEDKRLTRAFLCGGSSLVINCGDKCSNHQNHKIITDYVLRDIKHTVEFKKIRPAITGNQNSNSQSLATNALNVEPGLALMSSQEQELLTLYIIYKRAEIIMSDKAIFLRLYNKTGLNEKTRQNFEVIRKYMCEQFSLCGYDFSVKSTIVYEQDRECLYSKIHISKPGNLVLMREKFAPQLQVKIKQAALKNGLRFGP